MTDPSLLAGLSIRRRCLRLAFGGGALWAACLPGWSAPPAETSPSDPTPLPPTQVVGQVPGVGQVDSVGLTILPGAEFFPGGRSDTRDLNALAPNLAVFDGNNSRSPRFSVRGIRENGFLAGEPAVSVYVDDVPFTDLASRGRPLFDVQQATLLRGAQGTLFGAAPPGGVLNVQTRQPGNTWEGLATGLYGNYNQRAGAIGVSGPIVQDQLAFSVSGLYGARDGFVDNLTLNTHPDSQETFAGRVQLRWTPSEPWTVDLWVTGEKFNDGFVATYYPGHDVGPFDVYRDEDGYVNTDALGEAFRVAYQTTEVKFTSVTSHRHWDQDLLQDFDFTGNKIRDGFSNPTLEQWSQEFRAQSIDTDATFRWLAGFFFLDAAPTSESGSVEYFPITLSQNPAPLVTQPTTFTTAADNVNRTYALFGQGSYAVTERFSAIAGVRFECNTRSIDRQKTVSSPNATFGGFPIGPFSNTYGVYSGSESFERVLPKAGLSYRLKPELEAYFSFASGYQSGGFNASSDTRSTATYLPWVSWQYELGIKSAWWENRIEAHASVFLIDSQNYQVYRLNDLDPTQAYVQNAAEATSLGAELEVIAHAAEGLDLSVSGGYTDARYDDYTNPIDGVSYDGNTIAFVPQFTATGALQYTFPFGLYLRVEGQGIGRYYLTEDNTAQQSAYGLLNARIGFTAKHWEVFLFGRNLTNKRFTSNALDLRNAFQPDLLILQPGDPLTFGIAVNARF